MKKLSHIGDDHRPSMVDVSGKPPQKRTATARGRIILQPETLALIGENMIKKGNVLLTAELAGIQAAKKTSDLIPLCHPLLLSKIDVKAVAEGTPENFQTGIVTGVFARREQFDVFHLARGAL